MSRHADTGYAPFVQIKHADNVAKGFALSTSVVLTFGLSIAFFNYHLTALTAIGATTVVITAYAFEKFAR